MKKTAKKPIKAKKKVGKYKVKLSLGDLKVPILFIALTVGITILVIIATRFTFYEL